MNVPTLSQRLYLLRELVWRDFQGRYAGSTLGLLWSFVPLLFQLALFTFVFSTVMVNFTETAAFAYGFGAQADDACPP